ncbi:MAG: hypothetical protein KGZ82_06930 [Bacteroidales bacterium]|nr:hypothetical protein [Bacteroidales bacterium]
MKHKPWKFIIYIFLLGCLGFTQKIALCQPYSKKTERLYNKAKNWYLSGKTDKAEKTFIKITCNEAHGCSYYYLAEIEKSKNNPRIAKDYFERSIMLMVAEFDSLSRIGLNSDRTAEIGNLISLAQIGLSEYSGEAKEKSKLIKKPKTIQANNDTVSQRDTVSEIYIDDMKNIQLKSFPKSPIRIYNNAESTTFYAIKSELDKGYILPTLSELEQILNILCNSNAGREVLNMLSWGNNNSLRFISSSTYFNDNNEHVCEGFILKKNAVTFNKIEIELGDSGSVIMINR